MQIVGAIAEAPQYHLEQQLLHADLEIGSSGEGSRTAYDLASDDPGVRIPSGIDARSRHGAGGFENGRAFAADREAAGKFYERSAGAARSSLAACGSF